MVEFLKEIPTIRFMALRKYWYALSALVVVAPVLMAAAFFAEPVGPGLKRHFTLPAVVAVAVGTLLHAVSGIRTGVRVQTD